MVSEAQKRASANYRRRATESGDLKRIALEFYPPDRDLYEWLQQHKPMATYIKNLIREDIARN